MFEHVGGEFVRSVRRSNGHESTPHQSSSCLNGLMLRPLSSGGYSSDPVEPERVELEPGDDRTVVDVDRFGSVVEDEMRLSSESFELLDFAASSPAVPVAEPELSLAPGLDDAATAFFGNAVGKCGLRT